MKKTGFNQKKVTNILQRTFKAEKIKRAAKGINTGAQSDLIEKAGIRQPVRV
jgi:hypothetical protein